MDIVDYLLSRIKVNAKGCFEWQGGLKEKGYGQAFYQKKNWRAHKLSYTVFRGPVPDGKFVCHECDNPCCINPAHLFLGTPKQNQQDAVKKGRMQHGERHYNAKLTKELVAEMRRIRQSGLSYESISKQFGISASHVQRVCKQLAWKSVS